MNQKELDKKLELHKLWLEDKEGGVRLDLRDVNLQFANLQDADLRDADLQGANLQYADLQFANLRDADLQFADLRHANLQFANLRDAKLRHANLRHANLQDANLRDADLRDADLQGANLRDAKLQNADLQYANLQFANLQGANLRRAKFPHYSVCPQEGSFIAWKKGADQTLIKLFIPAKAKRLSVPTSRKCRASMAKVLLIFNSDGEEIEKTLNGTHKVLRLMYTRGEYVKADSFDPDIRADCSHGIHFFMTRKEAEEW